MKLWWTFYIQTITSYESIKKNSYFNRKIKLHDWRDGLTAKVLTEFKHEGLGSNP